MFTQLWVFFANKNECFPLYAFFIYLFTHTQLIFYEPKIFGDKASTKLIELSVFMYLKPSVFLFVKTFSGEKLRNLLLKKITQFYTSLVTLGSLARLD